MWGANLIRTHLIFGGNRWLGCRVPDSDAVALRPKTLCCHSVLPREIEAGHIIACGLVIGFTVVSKAGDVGSYHAEDFVEDNLLVVTI